MKTRSNLAAALLAALAWPTAGNTAAPPVAPPSTVPAADFFNYAGTTNVSISPDGRAVALLVRNTAGRRQLAVLDTSDVSKFKIVASFAEFDIARAHWADSKTLVFSLRDETESAFGQQGAGLYAVGADGDGLRPLINFRGKNTETGTMIKSHSLDPYIYTFGQTLHDDSGDIVISHWSKTTVLHTYGSEWTGNAPMRMSLSSGVLSDIGGKWPDHVDDWLFDGTGHVRAAMQDKDGQTTLLVRDDAGEWHARSHFPSAHRGADDVVLEEIGADGQGYATKLHGEEGAEALYRYDLATGKADAEPIVSVKGFDVGSTLVEDYKAHKVLGVHYEADAAGTVWFDPDMKALQAKVDARLPGLINRIDPADCGCAQRVLVTSHSDHQPPLFFLYDRGNDTLTPFGSARIKINPRQMADTDFFRIKARDGHDLPVYVTKPHGKGPWPTVVLVHGGPSLRGWHWRWDDESQFLASRGYLVVKPEFRGSEGYGAALESAGHKQWGLKMQDDIADATVWAAQQGLEDPKRTCIMGGSYGGYATLMGLVRYPDLYRCGVAASAVTDINLMYDIGWSDAGSQAKNYAMPEMIGDQVADAEQLKATSPILQASRITRPLLLAHGGVDRRVPIAHATKLLSALDANKAHVTWIEYKDEAHGWYKPETRIGYYEEVQKFLDANIGPGATAPAQ
ncbi:alpha/beta hydrolase family protein [Scleromatobacter humisilvae]|uniref:Prolyl oligopeptidase family serine peptidase n=1 Tax=Scleromatobacter humisilvae TaxID=2897159 RepID=A0A9X1YJY1_9BURK|nr:prolyl oligopeptidase family serine peptidase [Scleromatobacter humisilvae]MCK9685747.1 prolyl oligopeptidase family serine peptidase [Scleromatobacter humisilvae]